MHKPLRRTCAAWFLGFIGCGSEAPPSTAIEPAPCKLTQQLTALAPEVMTPLGFPAGNALEFAPGLKRTIQSWIVPSAQAAVLDGVAPSAIELELSWQASSLPLLVSNTQPLCSPYIRVEGVMMLRSSDGALQEEIPVALISRELDFAWFNFKIPQDTLRGTLRYTPTYDSAVEMQLDAYVTRSSGITGSLAAVTRLPSGIFIGATLLKWRRAHAPPH